MVTEDDLQPLRAFLARLPAMDAPRNTDSIGSGVFESGNWWAKFRIELHHPLAWRTVQELGHVLNYISLDERLPTVFMPVSPPPDLNGGEEFLSWVIESTTPEFTPGECVQWLEAKLPQPVEDEGQWDLTGDPEEENGAEN